MAQVMDSPASSPRRSVDVTTDLDLDLELPFCNNNTSPASHSTTRSGGDRSKGGESDVFEFKDDESDGDDDEDDRTQDHDEDDRAFQKRRQQGAKEIDSLLMENPSSLQSCVSQRTHQSQHSNSQMLLLQSQSQAMSEMLTQNADFTQMTQDDNDAGGLSLSPFPPCSPVKPQQVPWGRLMPCMGAKAIQLLPKGPEREEDASKSVASQPQQQQQQQTGPYYTMVGLEQLKPSDIFNVYSIGRSAKNEIVSPKPSKLAEEKEHKWQAHAYGLISNRHCRIYCTLPEDPKAASIPGSSSLPAASMEVWVEDASNNGTTVNQTILLKRGQKRRLHSGDEISLINPETLRKRGNDDAIMQKILQQHSFIFVNIAHQQQQQQKQQAAVTRQIMDPLGSFGSWGSFPAPPPPASSAKRRTGMVNVRAMKYSGIRGATPHRSPVLAPNWGQAVAKSGNGSSNSKENQNQPVSSSSQVDNSCQVPTSANTTAPKETATPRRVEQDYDIRDLLGRGTCGEVRRAIHRQSGKEFAVKIIALPAPGLVNQKQQAEAQQWQAEARILQTLDHPYVVKLADVYCSDTLLYLVMELCSGGDLFDRIIQTTKYTEYDSRRVMRRLLSAMHYIHEDCQLVHRDIKPENILLTSANDPCDVKITDFGVAKSAASDLKTFCGTPLYFAPEVLKRRHTVHGQGRYGKAADVWSLGVILYILLSGTPPFNIDGAQGFDVILKSSVDIHFHPQQWGSISAEAVDLIRRMLVKDPRRRITIREACDHPWILTEDGDTHRHPLEDPKVMSVTGTRKRLFPGSSPTPVSTVASPEKALAKRRRKVSMESSVRVSKGNAVKLEDKTINAETEGKGLVDTPMDETEDPQTLASSAEKNSSRPVDISPESTPVTGDRQANRSRLGTIDETVSSPSVKDDAKLPEDASKIPLSKEVTETPIDEDMSSPTTKDVAKSPEEIPKPPAGNEAKLPDQAISPQKLSPKLAEALKASILSGASATEKAKPKCLGASIRVPTSSKENVGDLSNAVSSDTAMKRKEANTSEELPEEALTKSKRCSKNGKDKNVVMAAELDEDQICSQFSDDEEELDCGASSKSAAAPDEKETAADSSKKMTQLTLAPLPEATAANKTKTSKAKAKRIVGATKNGKAATESKAGNKGTKAGKQMTLMQMWK